MAWPGLDRLGLWLHLRSRRPGLPAPALQPPPGDGPLLLMRATQQSQPAAQQVRDRLQHVRPDLRILMLDMASDTDTARDSSPDPWADPAQAGPMLDRLRPFALLLLGADLPAGLILAAGERGIAVMLGDAHLDPADTGWSRQATARRALLRQMRAVMVADDASHAIARRIGLGRDVLSMTGPVTRILEPPRCTEAERAAFAQLMSGRHAWLAACIPPAEEAAVLAAHRAALRLSHRALLFLVPSSADRADSLADEIEAEGLIVARRSADEEPLDEVEVMISDGPTELGLWYRLAPVTYMGGTLSGDDAQARNPFEPAALGSAIVHGPQTGRFATQWRQLDAAHAARPVGDANALAGAIAELTQPELTASLASNAWTVSTGGVSVAMQIAAPVLDLLQDIPR